MIGKSNTQLLPPHFGSLLEFLQICLIVLQDFVVGEIPLGTRLLPQPLSRNGAFKVFLLFPFDRCPFLTESRLQFGAGTGLQGVEKLWNAGRFKTLVDLLTN